MGTPTKVPIHCPRPPNCERKHESVDLETMLQCRGPMISEQGLTLATHAGVVTNWYRQFRKHRKFFLPVNSAKDNLPPFLHANPDICTEIRKYAKENLETLLIEMLSGYIHDKALPMLHIQCLLNLLSAKRIMS